MDKKTGFGVNFFINQPINLSLQQDKTLDNYKTVNNQYGYEEQGATSLANHLAMTQVTSCGKVKA